TIERNMGRPSGTGDGHQPIRRCPGLPEETGTPVLEDLDSVQSVHTASPGELDHARRPRAGWGGRVAASGQSLARARTVIWTPRSALATGRADVVVLGGGGRNAAKGWQRGTQLTSPLYPLRPSPPRLGRGRRQRRRVGPGRRAAVGDDLPSGP